MKRYLVELPHSNEECLKALDETREYGRPLLPVIDWGCGVGNHNGWLFVGTGSESEARDVIQSAFLRGKARVTELTTYSATQIESFHKK